MRQFENLRVWQDSRLLVSEIYNLLRNNKDFGFRDQIQRAAVSIMNNIAEGSEMNSDVMFIRYLKIAKGSAAEVRSMIYICEDLEYLTTKEAKIVREKTILIASGIQKLIEYLEKERKNNS